MILFLEGDQVEWICTGDDGVIISTKGEKAKVQFDFGERVLDLDELVLL